MWKIGLRSCPFAGTDNIFSIMLRGFGEWYKGYFISGESRPRCMSGCSALGTVCKPGRLGSIVEIKTIEAEGAVFQTREEAERHGLELARKWVDEQISG